MTCPQSAQKSPGAGFPGDCEPPSVGERNRTLLLCKSSAHFYPPAPVSFKVVFYYVSQVGLEFVLLPPPPSKCWDDRPILLCLARVEQDAF